MGIRLHNSSWRQPLIVLDCWPPLAWTPHRTSFDWWQRSFRLLAQACRRGFRRLIASDGPPSPHEGACDPVRAPLRPGRPCMPALRVSRREEQLLACTGNARLVISGRMSDVCDELDRLAALEARQDKRRG